MSKILFVEDDASLSEIYSIRLTAEGYALVTAHDGEEALAVAVRERPDLIVSDVMMPKISGFDMLDILRHTPETQNIRVIMMTALSSEEERQRGEQLGADRYLVKSQVGIEDVVNAVHDVLGDRTGDGVMSATPAPATPQPTPPLTPTPSAPQATPATPAPQPPTPSQPTQPTPAPQSPAPVAPQAAPAPQPPTPSQPTPVAPSATA